MPRSQATARAWRALFACGMTGLLTISGCSSSSQPDWVASLGSGVTVDVPGQVSPGNGSPSAAVAGLVAAFNDKKFAEACNYVEPNEQAECKQGMAAEPASAAETVKNGAVGYAAIKGDQALVGTTGTYCSPDESPKCFTNNDPAAIFSSKKSFATLWSEANNEASNTNPRNVYSLAPCVKVDGKWYLNS